jgi:NAD(P)-dependent dehydrogenase (short-subunit alcohol dehydrogenase family)
VADAPRVALVTGGARRLGRALSLALAGRGYHVAVHFNQSAADAEQLVTQIRTDGGRASAFPADLSTPEAPADLIARVAGELGRLDVLVNSAAIMLRTPPGEVTLTEWESIFALNVRAPFFASQAAAARMPEGGVIVNMADLAAFETWPAYVPHGISKAAIVQMTRALARTLAPGIRVNAIAPGAVLLPEDWDESAASRLASTTPLRRNGAPEDVVRALLYFLDADFVTGEIMHVNGGRLVRR